MIFDMLNSLIRDNDRIGGYILCDAAVYGFVKISYKMHIELLGVL